jgi:hypothetical protein
MDKGPAPSRTNRRLTARHACHLGARYRRGEHWHPATAMDLSFRGCRLRLGEDLARGSSVVVLFESPAKAGVPGRAVELEARVIWSRLEGLSYQAGMLFLGEPPELHELLGSLA